ncbi:NYN domain-containing protein [Pseudoduganella sp. DS3]|uniref:NYN domain-containing protein n=1 Tax=Pseudoduganella guangdongensis TaxID=2692179 RepID=A0A6N9HGS0_9BURK|nr:NYN domain-containing protein [Pseudoduganella guangdongensis]MYN02791.1 NYN domain-containing protein [Pseudoduganella guangdongensis]
MASPNENASMALFCDFENVALGVRDANYEKFDIKPVLERLLLKGTIVVKKAYCDWDRYKGFKGPMHEANFELIEIPHVRLSGKNSADIRMVVDALDLCYTKAHVNTFVIISGDSDFSPLVSKLRENAKRVIGVGVKDSTSDLLVANCDEFIFYDDLVRESRRQRQSSSRGDAREQPPKRSPEEEKRRREEMDKRRNQCVDIAYTTFDALAAERGEGKIWASVLKEAIKRRKPDFSESYYGFRTFGNLLEEMKARGLLEFGRDEKSGAYVYRSSQPVVLPVVEQDAAPAAVAVEGEADAAEATPADGAAPAEREGRDSRRNRGNRGGRGRRGESAPVAGEAAPVEVPADAEVAAVAVVEQVAPVVAAAAEADVAAEAAAAPAKRTRAAAKKPAAKKTASRSSKVAQAAADAAEAVQQAEAVLAAAAEAAAVEAPAESAAKRARKSGMHKPSARSKLPKKPKAEAA